MSYIYNIISNNGPLIIVSLISVIFVSCHIIFGNKKISTYISNMSVLPEPKKIVVFDLDETLGCFVELGMFWDALNKISKNPQIKIQPLNNDRFFKLVEIFPEFLRPNIIDILEYLYEKKKNGECDKVMIYTNNQGPKQWTKQISEYFEHRIGKKIFDQIIAAFKVQGKIVEVCRTSHNKSVDDLVKCTKIPENTEICFLDDQTHPLMEKSNVYYINIKPYKFSMNFKDMAERYYNNFESNIDMEKDLFIGTMNVYMKQYNFTVTPKSSEELKVDEVIGKKIMYHLEQFFNKGKTRIKDKSTLKRKKSKHNNSKKHRRTMKQKHIT